MSGEEDICERREAVKGRFVCVFAVRSGWRLVPGPFASGPLPTKITAPRVRREKLREREKQRLEEVKRTSGKRRICNRFV